MAFPFGPPSGGEPVPRLAVTLTDDAGHATPAVDAVLDTGADGNVLNRLVFHYDGPRRFITLTP